MEYPGHDSSFIEPKDTLNDSCDKKGKLRHLQRGSIIVELTVALAILTAIGLITLKGSLNLMEPRQWTVTQNMTDSYVSYEQAYAERVSFEEMTATDSAWPVYPSQTTTEVEVGKLPGGTPLTAMVTRTRIPDPNNLPAAGGTGTVLTNPSETETWQLQSHLVYKIVGKEYVKSRTVIRSQ